MENKKITREMLIIAANELNDLMFDPPEIPVTGTEKQISEKIIEASELLQPKDKLSFNTRRVVRHLNKKEEINWDSPKAKRETMDTMTDILEDDVVLDGDEIEDDVEIENLPELPPTVKMPNPFKDEPVYEKEVTQETIDDVEQTIETKTDVKSKKKKGKRGRPPLPLPDVIVKRKGKRPYGESPHGIGIELMCKNPDLTYPELKKMVEEQVVVPTFNNGVRSAWIIVTKVVGLLRKNGLMK